MGVMSKLGGCCSFFGSVLTNKRRRLRVVVVLTAVLEITTAALAAQEAAKLQALVDHLESDNGAAPTDPAVMAYTLLVCNCAAEVVVVVIHIAYSFYFTFLRTCCSWCSGGRVSTMFGMLTTMTFYTSILSLALAGPLQSALSDYVGGLFAGWHPGLTPCLRTVSANQPVYDKTFSNFQDITYTASGFTWSNATDFPLYRTTFALFYASGALLFILWGVLLLSRSLLVSEADDEDAARQDARPPRQQQQQPDRDEESGGGGGGFFNRFRGGKGDAPAVPMQPMDAPRQAAMPYPVRSADNPLFGGGAPSLPSKPSNAGGYGGGGGGGDGGNPFDSSSASSNPWGAPSGGGSPWGDAPRGAQLYEMGRK